MSSSATASPPVVVHPDPVGRPREVDNRAAYLSFGLAYVLGHGAAAASQGDRPLLDLPGWLPMTLLGGGLVVGIVLTTMAALRAQFGASPAEILSGRLLGAAWIAGFTALFLAVTGLTSVLEQPELQSVLWPAGSGLIVGLLCLAEGAVRRNLLHYGLGIWLALTSTAALRLAAPGFYWVLAVAGGGAYLLAAALEHRRLRPSFTGQPRVRRSAPSPLTGANRPA
ncbi:MULTISPECIES: ABC transporter permease [unclassified Streptomyces]|uniref:ABC transporter permease n=1 Tax=unclassified Streptomyces TaxID=2593676 RepID=UPI000A93C720|nr:MULTISPECIES: ABC transporter permease [unclassified Streptomyces]